MAIRKFHRTSTDSVVKKFGPFWALLNKSDAKTIVHTSLVLAGRAWAEKYIPLRFSNYIHRLGYRVTEQWKKYKRRVLGGSAIPLIGVTPPGGGDRIVRRGNRIYGGKARNHEKMAVAVQRGTRVYVKGTSQGGDIHVAIPYGHPVQQSLSDALKARTEQETQFVVDEAAKHMLAFIKTAQPVPGSRKGKITILGASTGIRSRVVGLSGNGKSTRKKKAA